MRQKPILPLTRDELEAMHTGSLLQRLKQLHECEESFELSDMYPEEVPEGQIVFKSSEEWKHAYQEVKAVLASREHVPGGAERAARRRRSGRSRARGRRDR
jgi:hypothetical protein